MGEVVTQSVSFEKWPVGKPVFDEPSDMFACLQDLSTRGYRGQVRVWPVEDNPRWDVEINGEPNTHITALLGDVVVLLGGTLESMSPEQYTARFGSE